MSDFLKAMQFRHACKKFDSDKKIDEGDFSKILEFGRISPSSFGMEQWKFLVVQTPEKRASLQEACWGQPQVVESSHVVIILAKVEDVKPGTGYVKEMFERRNLPEDAFNLYLEKYESYFKTEIDPYMNTFAWSSKQCYLALANMMTGAASLRIDSCPIEGFSREAVDTLLKLDTNELQTAVIVTFGYRAGEQTPCFRQDKDQVIDYI
ncbi:MAG: NAD(P)H-dependent oxidoreductase [Thiotrichaceae bacterium]